MGKPIRVALCDDHTMVRSGLHRILAEEADIEVVGEAGTAEEAVELAGRGQPDVLVMDLGLPDASGIAATAAVRQASPDTRVLVLTAHNDVAYVRRAFAAGASGYLLKEAADIELVQAVRTVASGRQYVHPTLGAAALQTGAGAERPAGPGGPAIGTRTGGAPGNRQRPHQRRDRRRASRLGAHHRDPPGPHPAKARHLYPRRTRRTCTQRASAR